MTGQFVLIKCSIKMLILCIGRQRIGTSSTAQDMSSRTPMTGAGHEEFAAAPAVLLARSGASCVLVSVLDSQ